MRIILADHHEHPRWALKVLLEEQPDFFVIGDVTNSQALLALARESPVDLILVDRDLPGICLRELIASLHTFEPQPIVFVMSSKPECSREVLDAGADIFVSKADQPDRLIENLHKYARRVDSGDADIDH